MSHCCHQTQFWALNAPKMRLWPGLCSGPRWGSLQRSPDHLTLFEGAASRQGRGGEGKGREGKGSGREERGGKGEGREIDPRNFENRSTPMVVTVLLAACRKALRLYEQSWDRRCRFLFCCIKEDRHSVITSSYNIHYTVCIVSI